MDSLKSSGQNFKIWKPIFRQGKRVKRVQNEEKENRRPVDRYNNRSAGGGVVAVVRHRHHNHHEKPEAEVRKPAANETHIWTRSRDTQPEWSETASSQWEGEFRKIFTY